MRILVMNAVMESLQHCGVSFTESHFGGGDEVSTYRDTEVTRAC